jgi:hypothetical protein
MELYLLREIGGIRQFVRPASPCQPLYPCRLKVFKPDVVETVEEFRFLHVLDAYGGLLQIECQFSLLVLFDPV